MPKPIIGPDLKLTEIRADHRTNPRVRKPYCVIVQYAGGIDLVRDWRLYELAGARSDYAGFNPREGYRSHAWYVQTEQQAIALYLRLDDESYTRCRVRYNGLRVTD